MNGTKKVKFGMTLKLVLLAILPVTIVTLIVFIMSGSALQDGMQSEALIGLSDLANSVSASYEIMDSGDWHLEADGLYKGDTNLSADMTLFDKFVEHSEADVTIFWGDTREVTSLRDKDTNERIIGTQAAQEVIDTVIKGGQDYESTDVQVNGQPYYAYYVPVRNSNNQVVGMVFAGKPSEEVNSFITQSLMKVTVVACVSILASIVVGILIGRMIASGIKEAEKVIQRLENGDLTTKVSDKAMRKSDEVGAMAVSLERLRITLGEIVTNIKNSSNELSVTGERLDGMANQTNETAGEINSAVEGISKGAMSQAEEVETASVQISKMGNEISDIVENMETLDGIASDMQEAGNQSEKIVGELKASNDKTVEAIEQIGRQIYATNESVVKIQMAVDAITEIASQTNLLSLNASIEAARAGEHGKGFAVVASEIQKLSEQSAGSAKEIEDIVTKLYSESQQSVAAMEEMKQIVAEQEEKLNETTEQFRKVSEGIVETRQATNIIQAKTEECDTSRKLVIDVMSNLSAISEENAASTEETTASMEELNATINLLAEEAAKVRDMSEVLEEKISIFKL
ncbi:MAG: methyl-accepting chemotaxis protein [Lachnospiraceae bacterium]|nr:methyl-accepting chemotaxis protein [Lachnospiraceae bacterium]